MSPSTESHGPDDDHYVEKDQWDSHESADRVDQVGEFGAQGGGILHAAAAEGGLGLLGCAPANWSKVSMLLQIERGR